MSTETGAGRAAPRSVILISGRGSNLRAIVTAVNRDGLPLDLCAVISNRPDAAGLAYARTHGFPARALDHTDFPDRLAFDSALRRLIDEYTPDLVILAGFMRILNRDFVEHYQGRMVNIHPSLLPAFPGLDTHRRALAAGVSEHGASVHFVTGEVDGGPIILQARVPVFAQDTPETLAARVLEQEHIIYPQALRWFAEGRLRLAQRNGQAVALLDGQEILFSKTDCL